jgi:hypothetical protein
MERAYVINPDLSHNDRDADYGTRDMVRQKWVVDPDFDGIGTCGNVKPAIKNGKWQFLDFGGWGDGIVNMYEAMSSALLMYRLACTFAGTMETSGPDGYKCVWQLPLKHKGTGECIMFGEHKGAASVDAVPFGERAAASVRR